MHGLSSDDAPQGVFAFKLGIPNLILRADLGERSNYISSYFPSTSFSYQ